ncbi:hypothetical protein [Planobispora takensis]|nr:hypothetical protein [Planobispora takensis]
MRAVLRMAGIVMLVQGVSGTIDQLAVQPFLGPILNFFNRFVVERVALLEGYEIFANLVMAFLGAAVTVAAGRTRPS